MDHELVDILDSNPWSEMATKIRNALETNSLSMGRFVLPMDERIISEFEADHKGDETELRLNLPPQPFIGNPEAKIWIVQFNPGYSSIIDDYDYLGIDNLPGNDYHKNRNVHSCLRERLGLVCRQYNFEQSEFYPLNAMFHTFGSGFRDGRGTFLWYETTLFNNADSFFGFIDVESRHRFASENIFVLEFFPYHSKSFGGMNFFPFLPSFEFWRSLMQYAFTHEKIVACHGLEASKSLTSAAIRSVDGYSNAKDEGYIYKIVSSENGRSRLLFGRQNVKPLHDSSTRLIDWLSSLQNRT